MNDIDYENLKWRCEICKEMRPEKHIVVTSYPLKFMKGAQRSISHCRDKPECMDKALEKKWSGKI